MLGGGSCDQRHYVMNIREQKRPSFLKRGWLVGSYNRKSFLDRLLHFFLNFSLPFFYFFLHTVQQHTPDTVSDAALGLAPQMQLKHPQQDFKLLHRHTWHISVTLAGVRVNSSCIRQRNCPSLHLACKMRNLYFSQEVIISFEEWAGENQFDLLTDKLL